MMAQLVLILASERKCVVCGCLGLDENVCGERIAYLHPIQNQNISCFKRASHRLSGFDHGKMAFFIYSRLHRRGKLPI